MREGRTQSPGVGKGREQRLCCAPQMEAQIFPRAFVEGAQLGDGYPCTHASLSSGLLCLSAASSTLPLLLCAKLLAALCSVSGEQFSRCLLEAWTELCQAKTCPGCP